MTYAGLTTADKPALLDAKARGAEWVAREKNGALWGHKSKPRRMAVHETRYETWSSDGSVLGGIVDVENSNLRFIQWSDAEPVNIDLALAQIAEMETAQTPTFPPLTWNERINQMTVEEKARDLLFANAQDHAFKGTPLEGKFCYIALDGGYYGSSDEAIAASEKFLNSPYTEGATK